MLPFDFSVPSFPEADAWDVSRISPKEQQLRQPIHQPRQLHNRTVPTDDWKSLRARVLMPICNSELALLGPAIGGIRPRSRNWEDTSLQLNHSSMAAAAVQRHRSVKYVINYCERFDVIFSAQRSGEVAKISRPLPPHPLTSAPADDPSSRSLGGLHQLSRKSILKAVPKGRRLFFHRTVQKENRGAKCSDIGASQLNPVCLGARRRNVSGHQQDHPTRSPEFSSIFLLAAA